jgi:hypothetical protein
MAFTVEDGTGIKSANAYVTVQELKDYHADRGNTVTGGAGDQQKALVKATDYLDKRFGPRFKGIRQYSSLTTARSTLSASANPADADTVTIGSVTYVILDTLTTANDVQRGANAQETLLNLLAAINGSGTEGVEYGTGTVEHPDAAAEQLTNDRVLVFARADGTPGNGLATTVSSTALSFNFAVTTGGSDDSAPQPLEFPRSSLHDRYGNLVRGIPRPLKQAVSEYALRILNGATLDPDPVFDASGRIIRRSRDKVGPIEVEAEYEPGGALQVQAHPAADNLIRDYLTPLGGVFR